MTLILTVTREASTESGTLGRLTAWIDGKSVFNCWTLEDPIRPAKIAGDTAIPRGTYKISNTVSQRFGKLLPILWNVPNFEGVRIHGGNDKGDTHGCILVGMDRKAGESRISNCAPAVDRIVDLINKNGHIAWLDVG